MSSVIECPACKGTVSLNAKSCPHCGEVNPGNDVVDNFFSWIGYVFKNILKLIGFLIILLVIDVLFGTRFFSIFFVSLVNALNTLLKLVGVL